MADQPKAPKRINVKVLDADTGKELATHQVNVPDLGGSCCCCTTTHHHPGNGPPEM